MDAVDALPERLRRVVIGYFFEERSMQDLADELGVSESRISQLRAEALLLLEGRHQLAARARRGARRSRARTVGSPRRKAALLRGRRSRLRLPRPRVGAPDRRRRRWSGISNA